MHCHHPFATVINPTPPVGMGPPAGAYAPPPPFGFPQHPPTGGLPNPEGLLKR